MKVWYDYQKSGEYSLIVITEKGEAHSHFSCAQLAGMNDVGEKVLLSDPDGTFPKECFNKEASYADCCAWFEETASRLRSHGHSVYTYTEDTDNPFPNKRMLVNLPDEAVAYMEANNQIFLTDENVAENISGKVLGKL